MVILDPAGWPLPAPLKSVRRNWAGTGSFMDVAFVIMILGFTAMGLLMILSRLW